MKRTLFALTVLLFWPGLGFSQTTDDTIHLRATHDGVDTDSYRLVMDGTVTATAAVSSLGVVEPGYIDFEFGPGTLAAGDYQVSIESVGPGGMASNIPTLLSVTAPPPDAPAAPGPVEIVVDP